MPTSIPLDDSLTERLHRLGADRKRSTEGMVRDAIEQYVVREEARTAFIAEAEIAWSEYQRTGQHLAGAEAPHWLATWGSEQEAEAPPCHD